VRCPNCDVALEVVEVEPAKPAKLAVRAKYPKLVTLRSLKDGHPEKPTEKLTESQKYHMTTLKLTRLKGEVAEYWCDQGNWGLSAKYEGIKLIVFGHFHNHLNGMEVVDITDW